MEANRGHICMSLCWWPHVIQMSCPLPNFEMIPTSLPVFDLLSDELYSVESILASCICHPNTFNCSGAQTRSSRCYWASKGYSKPCFATYSEWNALTPVQQHAENVATAVGFLFVHSYVYLPYLLYSPNIPQTLYRKLNRIKEVRQN